MAHTTRTRITLTAIIFTLLATALIIRPQTATAEIVIDGDPAQIAATETALELFATAGLELPAVTISFHDNREPCNGYTGLATAGADVTEIAVCKLGGYDKTLLHELAHIWADENLTDQTRNDYVTFSGAWSWIGEGEWFEQGTELAADTIMWAVTSGEMPMRPQFPTHLETTLEAGYQLLTR